ncbi:MAG: hypothetical protein A2Y34_07415 [Spirochaetes bacterium GWC1_27_15]|nr:MAG: hypothetical protein A2Y34_07415 [Spirochaetes bacterium GWC1_27_15]
MPLYKNNLKIYIVPIGGIYVTKDPMVLQTVLGSCVSVTLFDKKLKFGGMNHIVLPGSFIGMEVEKMIKEKDSRYGIFSLEKLIYEMLNFGSQKKDMEAKIFGASFMGRKKQILDIQTSNVEFVKSFLDMAKIKIVEELTLQNEALKIFFNTQTGIVEVERLNSGI